MLIPNSKIWSRIIKTWSRIAKHPSRIAKIKSRLVNIWSRRVVRAYRPLPRCLDFLKGTSFREDSFLSFHFIICTLFCVIICTFIVYNFFNQVWVWPPAGRSRAISSKNNKNICFSRFTKCVCVAPGGSIQATRGPRPRSQGRFADFLIDETQRVS